MKSAITQVTYLLNDPMVSLYSYHFMLRKSYFFWEILFKTNCLQHFNVLMLLMEVSKCWKIKVFSKISIKIKNSKTVYEAQTASCFKGSTQPLPDRKLLTSLKQNFSDGDQECADICFPTCKQCSSWVSRNGAVQIIFLTPTRNIFAGKFVKWVRVLAALQEYNFYNIEWVEVRLISEVSWAKLYCKMRDRLC